jgi:preprotein translocase subunit YajC
MPDPRTLLAMAAPPPAPEANPLLNLLPYALVFLIFYFVLILPMKNKQKKLESLVKELKAGDKVLINPGIFGTVVSVEDDALQVRIDDKTKIRVLKTAVSGLQGQTEREK